MSNVQKIVNATIQNSPNLKDAVHLMAKASDLQATGGEILKYQPFMNEFIDTLVNRILFQECHNSIFQNPLQILKGRQVPFGTDVQDNIANPAVATPYDRSAMSDVLTAHKPDVKTVYYRRNRQDKYPLTIYDETLKGAFVSEGDFNEFLQMLLNTLTNGDNIDEYHLMTGIMAQAIDDKNILTQTVAGIDTEENSRALIKAAKTKFLQFQFPSTEYNMYKKMATAAGIASPTDLTTWTTPERMAIVMRADVAAATDVDVLAKAFNMDKTEFMGRQIIVDSFGTGTTSSKTLAVLMDITAVRTHDNMFKIVNTPYNASTLSRNYYLHHWETMAYSPFANACAFVTA